MYVYMIILPYSAYLDSLTLITQCEEPWEPQLLLETCHHTSTWVYLYGTWPGRRIAMCYRKRNQSTVVIGWNWFVLLKHSNNIPSQKNKTYWRNPASFQTISYWTVKYKFFFLIWKAWYGKAKLGPLKSNSMLYHFSHQNCPICRENPPFLRQT